MSDIKEVDIMKFRVYPIHYQCEDSLDIKWSMVIHVLLNMLTIELRMVDILRARKLISSKHVSFWCPFLDSHLTTLHSNIGVKLRQVTELGLSTLVAIETKRGVRIT